MGLIKPLPDSVKKKIAAGEVVEGPFSIVKELIENSIDAGATQIDIQVAEGGLKRIVVGDNGTGIYRDDMALAVAEHATSKISDFHDIGRIRSYGFRGEALSSISSVSRLTILSRRAEDDLGSRLSGTEAGFEVTDFAGATGTTVVVENLFYNVPARKKFLKAIRTELRAIRESVIKIAIPNPQIAFNLDVDGRRQITLARAEDVGRRLEQIYGGGIVHDLYYAMLRDLKVSAGGFFSRPHFLKSSRSMQLLYVNKRPVDYRYLGFLLSRAYEAVAVKGKYPAGIIFLDVDPELVDVNIHPAKKEVKFFDSHYIDRLITSLAEKVLNREHAILDRLFVSGENQTDSGSPTTGRGFISRGNIAADSTAHELPPRYGGHLNQELAPPSSLVRDLAGLYHDSEESKKGKVLSIVFGTYIIMESNNSLYFIDFHAAHERIIYDSLVEKGDTYESQALAFPIMLELSIEDHALVMENIEKFSEIGFDIEDFSDKSIKISAVPMMARNANISDIIADFINSARDDHEAGGISARMAAAVACHAAKRAGDSLSSEDMDRLVSMALKEGGKLRCPHGRPFVYRIDREDIERIFKR